MPAAAQSKSERIDVRASMPVKQLLQEAARAAHKNVSEFLLDAGIVAANQTLAGRLRFELAPDQWHSRPRWTNPLAASPSSKSCSGSLGCWGEFEESVAQVLRRGPQTGRHRQRRWF